MKRHILVLVMLMAAMAVAWGQAPPTSFTLKIVNRPFAEAVKQIEKATDYSFDYEQSAVTGRKVTVRVNDAPIEAIVSALVKGLDIDYAIHGRHVVLTVRKPSGVTEAAAGAAPSNIRRVSGVVLDDNGEPLPGATIRISGSKNVTITDIDGRYTIDAPVGSKIRVDYVGFQTSTSAAVSDRSMNVDFKLESLSLIHI